MELDVSFIIFSIALIAIVIFIIWCIRAPKLYLLHKLYLALTVCYATWIIPVMLMRFLKSTDGQAAFILDCMTTPGGSLAPVIFLCIVLVFVQSLEHMPKRMWLLFIMPLVSVAVTWTNPLHHLQYRVFSVVRSEIVFGPYVIVSGLYTYFCLLMTIIIPLRFALRNKSQLYFKQCLLLSCSSVFPLIVNALATFSGIDLDINATPLSFIVPMILNGFAIYQMHLLDIRPMATQHVLDWISDCYLVLSDQGLVVSYNRQFEMVFGQEYGITENRYLRECVKDEDVSGKTAIYNMLTAVEDCKKANTVVTYEQAVTIARGDLVRRGYYVTEVSPLSIHEKISGFVVIFKDITQIKESMQQLQDSRERMMEQERLAFLGQMIGGLAHNLKTPIMGISGSISAMEALVDECEESLGDPDVTESDYREIYGEMREWFQKGREATSYMSDIITAIKGQAAGAVTYEDAVFTLDETFKRCVLLMRHELMAGHCQLKVVCAEPARIALKGDVNNLVQVLTNLLSNAVYAQQQKGGGEILMKAECDAKNLNISVTDTGTGVSSKVRDKLFKAMVTSKGAMGTGLGLYISSTVVKGKFGGHMWMKDNPEGGSIFGLSIPMKNVMLKKTGRAEGGASDAET
jgi:two-component system sensor histidine kinase HupT/HoxJ